MKNLNEITVTVREYLDNGSAVVTQPIIDSVHFLSNMFSIDSLDESQNTVKDEHKLTIPDESIRINAVFIDDEEIRELKNLNNLQNIKDMDEQRWYEFGGEILFTEDFTDVYDTQIFYKKGFIEPEAAVDTDVPDKYLELVYLGAYYRYYKKLLSQIATGKENIPDINATELRLLYKETKASFYEQLKMIKINE